MKPSVLASSRSASVLLACLLAGAAGRAPAAEFPGDAWAEAAPADAGCEAAQLERARDYALTAGGSGLIVRGGRKIMGWGDPRQRYDLKSTTKSFGAAALGLAIQDGKLRLEDKARQVHPTLGTPPQDNEASGWLDEITLLHLASQTAGFEKPGGYAPLLFRPGSEWGYSDAGPNWLAECITLAYRRDVDELMFERLFTPLGIGRADLVWRKNAYRPELLDGLRRREFGSGISASVDAMARFGYLWLRGGEWKGREILPREFVDRVRTTVPGVPGLPVRKPEEYGRASSHYGLLWWNNADGAIPGVPEDTYWSWGLGDSLIVVMPALDLVAARAGRSWPRAKGADHYDVLKPFLQPIAAAVQGARSPVRPSPVIKTVHWAPKETIIRRARGSDNWPMTWAGDGSLYTAYGDGRGFEPLIGRKLSLGLARLTGAPDHFSAANLRSATAESEGDGARGRKASGIVCVEGVLYLLVRNAHNAQLGWSADLGVTWSWADWKFTTSFGCPTFLNFGANYAGARDRFVYVYSPDADTAYEPADRMVLARVPADRLRDRNAYEFFAGTGPDGAPEWSGEVGRRGAVFARRGACYRSGVTYDAGLKRYLWCQTRPDHRGLAIFDAPEPWGPWTTVFEANPWDVEAGDSCSLPTRWMSADGRTVHLVFSGDDCFAVRQGVLELHAAP